MTNAEVLSVAASNGELVTQCACTRKPERLGKPNLKCQTCKGHGWLSSCQYCEGCGMTNNKICGKCGGVGSFPASPPVRPSSKKPVSGLP
jgi:DnaJ-class molecular chaperone